MLGNQAAERALDRADVPEQAALHPALRRAIDDARPRGRTLGDAAPDALRGLAAGGLSAVRVHDDDAAHALTAALRADAFTTGATCSSPPGRFDPHSAGGERLLAHELVHVAQQGGAAAAGELRLAPPGGALEAVADAVARGAPVPDAGRAPAGLVQRQVATAPPVPAPEPAAPEERRTSIRDANWWVEAEPATPLVQVGKTVTFRLRRSDRGTFRWRDPATRALGVYPGFVLRDPNGNVRAMRPPTDPYSIVVEFSSPGRWRGTFTGTPVAPAGPASQPFGLSDEGASIAVSLEVEVVDTAAADWGAKAATSSSREDVNRIEDPKASPGEAAVTFRRLVTDAGSPCWRPTGARPTSCYGCTPARRSDPRRRRWETSST